MMEIEKINKDLQAAKEQYKNSVIAAFSRVSDIIFEKYPEIKTIAWYNYTPYFNDGDPCQYTLCGPYFFLLEEKEIEQNELTRGEYDYSDDGKYTVDTITNVDYYMISGYNSSADKEELQNNLPRNSDLVEFSQIIKNNSDIVQSVYRDYTVVYITRSGTTIEDYEYIE